MKKLKLSLTLASCCLATTLSAQGIPAEDSTFTLTTIAEVTVKGEDITRLSTVSATGALQGQVPGATIIQNSAQPGMGYNINIRGIGTFGDSNPLYVIDGIAGGSLEALNPADIESVEILKDGASTALWGIRGGNGVVLVTTKRGGGGRTKVSYDGFYGWQNVSKMPSMTTAQDYMILINERGFNESGALINWENLLPENLYNAIRNGQSTNWLNEVYKKGAPTTNHTVNVSGGQKGHTYSVGLSYTGQDGIIRPESSSFRRFNLRVNTDNVAIRSKRGLDILTIGETLNLNYNKRHTLAEGDRNWNSIRNYLSACPLLPVYGEDGSFFDAAAREASGWNFGTDETAMHPILIDNNTAMGLNSSTNLNIQGSFYIQLQPIKGLKLKSTAGYLLSTGETTTEEKVYRVNEKYFNDEASTTKTTFNNRNLSWENTLSYDCTIASKHNLGALVGMSAEKWTLHETPGILLAYFANLHYNYDNRYTISATYRTDGSSYLKKGHRWMSFPSVSASWTISNERWMKPVKDWFSLLKLRASWGVSGNLNTANILNYNAFAFNAAGYTFGNKASDSTSAFINSIENGDLTGETSKQFNVGIDVRFFDSRLGLSIDGYHRTSSDCIIPVSDPTALGTLTTYLNSGEIRNAGIEYAIDWGKYTGDFQYGIKLNGAWNRNEVVRIGTADQILHGAKDVLSDNTGEIYRSMVGQPVGVFYGYKTLGVFQNHDEIVNYPGAKFEDTIPGELIYADINGDGILNEEDRTVLGKSHPDVTTGINLWFAYKGLDLSISGYGAFGQQIVASYSAFTENQTANFTSDMLDRWCGEGTSNTLPRLGYGFNRNWGRVSDLLVQDGSYFRLSNITLGYDFKQFIRNDVISRCRLYVAARNLATLTKYRGADPELNYSAGESWMQGIDLGSYPTAKTFLVGINLSF